jgi:hypothetical protein
MCLSVVSEVEPYASRGARTVPGGEPTARWAPTRLDAMALRSQLHGRASERGRPRGGSAGAGPAGAACAAGPGSGRPRARRPRPSTATDLGPASVAPALPPPAAPVWLTNGPPPPSRTPTTAPSTAWTPDPAWPRSIPPTAQREPHVFAALPQIDRRTRVLGQAPFRIRSLSFLAGVRCFRQFVFLGGFPHAPIS